MSANTIADVAYHDNVVSVTGSVTLANAGILANGVAWHSGDVIVDLQGVTDVDSSALSLIFEWQRAARTRGARLQVRNLPANLQSLATLYGVADLLGASA